MLDEKFVTALSELGPLSALVLVIIVLVWLLWAILKWMKDRDTANAEHVKMMLTSYANLNAANEGFIKRIEGLADQDKAYAEQIERRLRDERMERQSEIALLKGELADLQVKHQQALKEIALLRAEVAAKQAALDELEGKLQAIQKQRDSLKKELTAVQTQNSVMAAQISKLQDEREQPDPEPPVPVKASPRPRLIAKDAGEKDVVDLGDIKEVDDEEVA